MGAAPIPPPGKPQGAPQPASAPAKAKADGEKGPSAFERESVAMDRAANRIAEAANVIADAQRQFALWQLVLGAFGVVFTGFAAFFAYRATHWAKEAATQAGISAKADNDALTETRKAAEDARKEAAVQAKRVTEQLRLADETMQATTRTAIAMADSARENRLIAKAMGTAAEAAVKQANISEDTATKQLKAYLDASELVISWFGNKPSLIITLVNVGQTPAVSVAVGAKYMFGAVKDAPGTVGDVPGLAMEPNVGATPVVTVLHIQGGLNFEQTNVTRDSALFVLGVIQYADIFGTFYNTEFGFFTTHPTPTDGKMPKLSRRWAAFEEVPRE